MAARKNVRLLRNGEVVAEGLTTQEAADMIGVSARTFRVGISTGRRMAGCYTAERTEDTCASARYSAETIKAANSQGIPLYLLADYDNTIEKLRNSGKIAGIQITVKAAGNTEEEGE